MSSYNLNLAIAPYFYHDCDACHFLGNWDDPDDGTRYDLYVCKGTVIARYGDDGPSYMSGLPFVGRNRPLTVACRRAIQRGFSELMGEKPDLFQLLDADDI